MVVVGCCWLLVAVHCWLWWLLVVVVVGCWWLVVAIVCCLWWMLLVVVDWFLVAFGCWLLTAVGCFLSCSHVRRDEKRKLDILKAKVKRPKEPNASDQYL